MLSVFLQKICIFVCFTGMIDCIPFLHKVQLLNPLTPMSDRDRIFPYNINKIDDENKDKY